MTPAPEMFERDNAKAPPWLCRKYYNSRYNLGLRFPLFWRVAFENEEAPSADCWMPVGLAGPDGPDGRATFAILLSGLRRHESPREYMDHVAADLRETLHGFQPICSEAAEINDYPAAVMMYRYFADGVEKEELNATLFLGFARKVLMQFVCEAPVGMFDKLLRLFSGLTESARIRHDGLSLPHIYLAGYRLCDRCHAPFGRNKRPHALFDPRSNRILAYCGACIPDANRLSRYLIEEEGRKLCARAAEIRRQGGSKDSLRKAEQTFRNIVKRFPNLWMAHFGLGEALLTRAGRRADDAQELLGEGRRELEQAIALAPTHPEPLVTMAASLARTDIGSAVHYYSTASSGHHGRRRYLYPARWQSDNYWEMAIHAAEHGYEDVAVKAFCYALQLDGDYAKKSLSELPKAQRCRRLAAARLRREKRLGHSAARGEIHAMPDD